MVLVLRLATLMLAWLIRLFRDNRRSPSGAAARGAEGERIVADFLSGRLGYEIVARNWRNPHERHEEIDIVCRDGDILVFVEVKTRPAGALVPGYYTVDKRKKKALRRVIHAYLMQLQIRPRTFRFDIAEVITNAKTPPQVLHFQNVSLFPRAYHVLRWI